MKRLLLHLAGSAVPGEPGMRGALRVALNAREQMPDVEIEIIVQGPAVAQLRAGGGLAREIRGLLGGPGMVVSACANSMRSIDLSPRDLEPGVGVVPAAVSHLTQAQFEGAAYVRI
ncbi:hypothetical protein [Arthrobacter sp.]|uniref:DsrE family protein n=1 Tax=Arthrobacter sp. TaxID=1667 RepID=UPI003A92D553